MVRKGGSGESPKRGGVEHPFPPEACLTYRGLDRRDGVFFPTPDQSAGTNRISGGPTILVVRKKVHNDYTSWSTRVAFR